MQQIPDSTSGLASQQAPGSIDFGGRTFCVLTFGCQMNEHDSERVRGLFEAFGSEEVHEPEQADIVVYMTCCVREKADTRLFGQVASMRNVPAPHGRRIIAIGGCIGQRDGAALKARLGDVDVVFGTHNIAHLPALIEDAIEGRDAVEVLEQAEGFATDLPTHRDHAWHAWVPIMTGCDNFCTYCIVPYVRGREKSRPLDEVIAELALLAGQGVAEVTLLGQNVNSYGRDLYGAPRFSEVLRAAGESGIPRVRFATSHPKDLLPETIEAMASSPSIMPQLHLPVQSGSNRILEEMNRHYTAEGYLGLVRQVRETVGDIALSTDIIVGFPGETESDFLDTLELAKAAHYSQAFTFIYSPREGTPAATMRQDATHEEIQGRFDRLVKVVQDSAYEENQKELGATVPVLVEGASRRDAGMIAGRSPKNQTVHAPLPGGVSVSSLEGAFLDVHIDEAKTWYLSGTVIGG